MDSRLPRSAESTLLFVGVVSIVGYFLIAQGVHNLYPFSTFDMYSVKPSPTASRVVVRDAHGELGPLMDWVNWRCPDRPAIAPSGNGVYTIDDVEERMQSWLDQHGQSGGASAGAQADSEQVEVLRKVWRFESGGATRQEERSIARCRADRVHRT